MSGIQRGMVATAGIAVILIGAGEHLYRRTVERKYRAVVEREQQLHRRMEAVLAEQQRLLSDLAEEKRRGDELAKTLAVRDAELEHTVARLETEHHTIREMQLRLAAMQEQVDQLQGELATALHESPRARAGGRGAVELEKIVVSEAAEAAEGRVISVHPDWSFVVVNLGWNAVRIGDVVTILRDGVVTAKAKVERVQEKLSAATLLPEWQAEQVKVNDQVRVL